MRLMFARALTVALAVLGGAAAMAFPKLVIDEAVPEASPPVIADRAPSAVTVIRIAPAEAPSRPAPAGTAPHRARSPVLHRLHTHLQLGDRLGAPARADGTLPADSPGHLAAADEASPCSADARRPRPPHGPPRRRRPPPRRRRAPRPRPPLPAPRRRLPPTLGARSPRSSSSRRRRSRRVVQPPVVEPPTERRSGRSATSRSRPPASTTTRGRSSHADFRRHGARQPRPGRRRQRTDERSQLVADGRTAACANMRPCLASAPPARSVSPSALSTSGAGYRPRSAAR